MLSKEIISGRTALKAIQRQSTTGGNNPGSKH
jgi:hypothetical protein